MKRNQNQHKPTRKPTAEELLRKLRQLDDEQLKDIYGGDRCAGDCWGRGGNSCN